MRNHLGITLSLVLGALALFGAAPASADQSSTATGATPTIGAFAPVAVSTQRAIVTASINPNGSDTSCFVEWGETFAYGTVTDCSTTLSGTSNVLTSVVLQPLKANTIYHMHIVATNVNGTEATVDQAFITPVGTPPTIDVFAPTLVLVRSATVTASLNPNGQTTSCFVEYGQTTDYGLRADCPSTYSGTDNVLATVALQPLDGGTQYHFRMVATNHDGTTTTPDQALITPKGTPPTISVFAATFVKARSATLTASLNPNGLTTSCFVEYGQTTDYGLRVDCPSTYSGTSNVLATVFLQSLRPSTRYHFRMVATNHDGTTNSADQTLTTPAS